MGPAVRTIISYRIVSILVAGVHNDNERGVNLCSGVSDNALRALGSLTPSFVRCSMLHA